MTELEPATEIVENCPLCGDSKYKLLFWNYDRLYHLPGKFGTLQCEQCDLIRISPRPTMDAIGTYYPDEYGAYKTPTQTVEQVTDPKRSLNSLRSAMRNSVLSGLGYETGELGGWQKSFRPLLTKLFYKKATYGYGDLFPSYVPGGAALEVGIGSGAYLSYLKHHDWKVAGVDLSPRAAQVAKETFGIDVFIGQLEEAPFPNESFDYIRLSHVVEHFFDPVETMKRVYDLLRPGGIVYVEVPNAESISAQMSGKYWYGWDAPRHLFMFSPATLKKTLDTAGLKVSKTKTIMWNFFSWANTFEQEEKTGEKLPIRPSVPSSDLLKVKMQGVVSRVKHQLKPDEGDFICCWATKP